MYPICINFCQLKIDFFVLLHDFQSYLYILDQSLSLSMCFANISIKSVTFHSLSIFYKVGFHETQCSSFSLAVFVVTSKKSAWLKITKIFLILCSDNLIVLDFTFNSMVYFELIFT